MVFTISALFAIFWFHFLAYKILCFRRDLKHLKDIEPSEISWPKVSLIAPACNEAEHIESAAHSLLTMDYPNLELLLVNDRSTDRTGEIIARLAAADPRVKTINIRELPPGWLGKVHALDQGARNATGDWLLFSDADVHYQSTSLKKAITYCNKNFLDFLAVGPEVVAPTFLLKIFVAQFMHQMAMGFNAKRLQDPRRPDCIGAGAFNLMRRSALAKSEGFHGIRLDVLDDAAIALLIKKSGAKTGFLNGKDEIQLSWYDSLGGFIRGLEKNTFAFFQYSAKATIIYTLGVWALLPILLVLPFFTPVSWVLMLFTWSLAFYLFASGYSFKRDLNISPLFAFTLPLSFALLPLVFVRSAILTLHQKGTYWRGTFYPLEELKKNQRLKLIDVFVKSKSP